MSTNASENLYPIRAALLRERGPYLTEIVHLNRCDKDGWQRITRERGGEYLGRLQHSESNGWESWFLERTSGTSTRHPGFRAALDALATTLDAQEEI
ncbi:hypothetical protein [Nocardia sp. NPDC059239]|uniref:hypothetical protein n=1 Tax=Nocardia sp. NPDC059239 TaxID=3346785 RepID=UPI0036B05CBA